MALNEKFFNSAAAVEGEPFLSTVIYDGDGTDGKVITGVGFDPDLVWIKNRDTAYSHQLFDVVRGATKRVFSDLTNQEYTTADTLKSFITDGFTVGTNVGVNTQDNEHVAWCFKAGGAAVTTTPSGLLTSEVSANVDAGFSIVKFTSDSGAGLKVAHGLSSAPEMIIYKKLNSSQAWYVNTNKINGNRSEGVLNTNGAFTNVGTAWSSMSTSTLINSFTSSNGQNYIAYCFHSVSGVSKVGSYPGNGTTGQLIPTNFTPRFLLVKATSGLSYHNWYIFDSVRGDTYLKADRNDADQTSPTLNPTFGSTGFRWESGDNSGGWNASGTTYLYMAIA